MRLYSEFVEEKASRQREIGVVLIKERREVLWQFSICLYLPKTALETSIILAMAS